jgi:hypothetical protein
MATIKRSALWGASTIFLLAMVSCGGCPATPSIASISPSSAVAGGAGLALTINGGNFNSTSVVVWNGTALGTTFVSNNQLTAAVSSSNIADPDTAVVYVYNPVNGTTVVEGTAVTTNNNQCNSPGSNAISFVVSP